MGSRLFCLPIVVVLSGLSFDTRVRKGSFSTSSLAITPPVQSWCLLTGAWTFLVVLRQRISSFNTDHRLITDGTIEVDQYRLIKEDTELISAVCLNFSLKCKVLGNVNNNVLHRI